MDDRFIFVDPRGYKLIRPSSFFVRTVYRLWSFKAPFLENRKHGVKVSSSTKKLDAYGTLFDKREEKKKNLIATSSSSWVKLVRVVNPRKRFVLNFPREPDDGRKKNVSFVSIIRRKRLDRSLFFVIIIRIEMSKRVWRWNIAKKRMTSIENSPTIARRRTDEFERNLGYVYLFLILTKLYCIESL